MSPWGRNINLSLRSTREVVGRTMPALSLKHILKSVFQAKNDNAGLYVVYEASHLFKRSINPSFTSLEREGRKYLG